MVIFIVPHDVANMIVEQKPTKTSALCFLVSLLDKCSVILQG
jgi:hypothetical protein